MYYSSIGTLAVIIHLIINIDIIRRKGGERIPAMRVYRPFLFSVIAFHVSDAVWGLLYQKSAFLLYADTVVFFASMALSLLLWTKYVLRYLEGNDRFGKILYLAGWFFFVFQIAFLIVNFFTPIVFRVDEAGEYYTGAVRYLLFFAQIVMFLLTSVYTLIVTARSHGTVKHRHLTIGLFGIAIVAAVTAQIIFPLLPMYSIGYLIGGCVLHTFVLEDERREFQRKLAESHNREEIQRRELGTARDMAFTDPLTGVKSKRAYSAAADDIDRRIADNSISKFAVVVFDVNDLKSENDTHGHEAGDALIKEACRLICVTFKHSPVFRIGGDEFAAILRDDDYADRSDLIARFNEIADNNLAGCGAVVSAGIAEFDREHDEAFGSVFRRADREMYKRKKKLKEKKDA